MFLIFDTETTGLPKNFNASLSDSDNWPRMVQLSWIIFDSNGIVKKIKNDIIKPDDYEIPFIATQTHGITTELAYEKGIEISISLNEFIDDLKNSKYIVCHNKDFDINIVGSELYRLGIDTSNITENEFIDTCSEATAELCKIKSLKRRRFKFPKLEELYYFLFNEKFDSAHNAIFDVAATGRCFFELIRIGEINPLDSEQKKDFIDHNKNKFKKIEIPSDFIHNKVDNKSQAVERSIDSKSKEFKNCFIHIRNKTVNSILESTININSLVDKAKELNMSAVGLTDNNMFGAFSFVSKCQKENIKPILGSEFNVCENMHRKSSEIKDFGHKQIFLAKNFEGYKNLIYLSSVSYTEGFYYIPRIDKKKLMEYSSDLICINGGIGSDIYNCILNEGKDKAKEIVEFWKEVFEDDLYLEISRHGIEEQTHVNSHLIEFSKIYDIPILATNNCYFLEKKDYDIEDLILCIKTNNYKSTSINDRVGFKKYAFLNEEFYFKAPQQIYEIFKDIPQAIENTKKVADKIESFSLERDVILPHFEIPKDFAFDNKSTKSKENQYLEVITYKGAKKIYKTLDLNIKSRLDFELATIEKTGYPSYFLLVKEIIDNAKNMGIFVGPGRGSVAGSLVAYCIGITLIDPLKYDLLFERFLNPDRVSMPDIDIDIDNNDRDDLINWIFERFGTDKVAQIIAYGIIKTKNAIRDTGRVMELALSDTNKIAKMVPPEKEKLSLKKIIKIDDKESKKYVASTQEQIKKIKKVYKENAKEYDVIKFAAELEQLNVYRNITVHACGIIIAPDDIKKYIPLATTTEKGHNRSITITQFDKNIVEKVGLLKIDLLGLNNLNIIKTTLEYIKSITKKSIDINSIPLDDKKTLEVFQKGDTTAIFQFESLGMKKYLKDLKPTEFEHLIAMNALYRPGPMQYIPDFIKRKEGKEKVSYDHPLMEKHLKYTYGITVYQEQVMLISQDLAGFSKGEADNLRKAIGKKDSVLLEKTKVSFFEGCKKNNININTVKKIWKDWENFANYAFNRSHCVSYTLVAFQTAYLKAHFPLEYMSSVMSSVNEEKVTGLLEECKIKNYPVLGPDINESNKGFYVNEKKQIRYGFSAIKGLGRNTIYSIINERNENGKFINMYDFIKRVPKKMCSKKGLDSMIVAGVFDSFKINRPTLYNNLDKIISIIRKEKEKDENQTSIFAAMGDSQSSIFKEKQQINELQLIPEEDWSTFEKVKKEKEIMGFWVSGHPLDKFKVERKYLCKNTLRELNEAINDRKTGKTLIIAGVVTSAEKDLLSKRGNKWGKFTIDDDTSSHTFSLFGEAYLKFNRYVEKDLIIFLKITTKFNEYYKNVESSIIEIGLMEDIVKEKLKKLSLNIYLDDINLDISEKLNEIFSKSEKGDANVMFNIKYNFNQKDPLELHFRKANINLNKQLLDNVCKILPQSLTVN